MKRNGGAKVRKKEYGADACVSEFVFFCSWPFSLFSLHHFICCLSLLLGV